MRKQRNSNAAATEAEALLDALDVLNRALDRIRIGGSGAQLSRLDHRGAYHDRWKNCADSPCEAEMHHLELQCIGYTPSLTHREFSRFGATFLTKNLTKPQIN